MRILFFVIVFALLSTFPGFSEIKVTKEKTASSPRIVNIVNFVRLLEPRRAEDTEEVLYETVVRQIEQLNKYELRGTFLLQYDALIDPRYQQLLKNKLFPGSEIGGWWEITKPHAEAAGLVWRGRYPWDWHANVGFATGYTPEERRVLVDVYMDKFKEIFGKYPSSIGSWFIDAVTLAYMSDKYHIVASCNCKDQVGTDGYTLWGGYWNQAYYPSRKNAYMPAQTAEGQIPVPIFRMLGSDPIYQYDTGLGLAVQGVFTLEPACKKGGGTEQWVDWFFKTIFEEPCLAFGYTQTGQENSFTWKRMEDGLDIQIPLLSSLFKSKKIRVETLSQSGAWFKEKFPLTPPTAVTALTDHQNGDRKSVWYNSRFYRANLFWEGPYFRFRDIHVFNEDLESEYLKNAGTSTKCVYMTLPIVDGFLWSTKDKLAGLRIMCKDNNGEIYEIRGNEPKVKETDERTLRVEWLLENNLGTFIITFYEDRIEARCQPSKTKIDWFFEFTAAPAAELPFTSFAQNKINAALKGLSYAVSLKKGLVDADSRVFKIIPEKNHIVLNLAQK